MINKKPPEIIGPSVHYSAIRASYPVSSLKNIPQRDSVILQEGKLVLIVAAKALLKDLLQNCPQLVSGISVIPLKSYGLISGQSPKNQDLGVFIYHWSKARFHSYSHRYASTSTLPYRFSTYSSRIT